jgi:hypothetical protein
MSRGFEWHIPENVVDQMNDVLVEEIFFLDKFARGRATGMHNKSTQAQSNMQQNRQSLHIQFSCHKQAKGFFKCHIGMSLKAFDQYGTNNFIKNVKQEKPSDNK